MKNEDEPTYESVKPALLNTLRRKIESGDYEEVENIIWSNPRCLITCTDSAVYLMAGPKYNAAHISARSNKPDILALILDTITNLKYIRLLYPKESNENLRDRANHLLDSYLNTPDPRQGNTPLHFACKLGNYKVVRVLLTFEGCDLTQRDSNGSTSEQCICEKYNPPPAPEANETSASVTGDTSQATIDNDIYDVKKVKDKIHKLFKQQLAMPAIRLQLRNRLAMERRRSRANSTLDSSMEVSFSDVDDSFIKKFGDLSTS